ncbi:type 1 glutamine amidotransferase domain-containing protein [Methylobrevis pamukkalensis]|uniref:Putative cysteine protease YraA n=1 Tax=Methylobrevis pamukkalensis TaxID=1439726 RepID=A0A1E3H0M3_9HYPH|nr:type 1 glutamine amidotransferase domain-containing protein [Methylobrevis pamukkalensis]ODN69695.1 putative cysteine protease YraA [Methylobrevis pamukkalensis]
MPDIREAKILIISASGFEQSELMVPLEKLRAAGATVEIASLDGKPIRGWAKTDWGETIDADLSVADARVDDYHALVIPGGQINPDLLRVDPNAVKLVRTFFDKGWPVAAICHGPWLLVEADLVRGRKVTSYPSIRTDVQNAGGRWIDAEVVTDEGVITSRNPDDLDAFVAKIIEEIGEGRHERRKAA